MSSYKIGIFGSAAETEGQEDTLQKAEHLGYLLGQKQCTVITGGCSGFPYIVAYAAAQQGAEVWGFSRAHDSSEQQSFTPNDDLSIYSKLIYIPQDFIFTKELLVCTKYRNVLSTATSDAGIIIAGRWGTLNEFTNLVDMGKVIGVLTGTGGIADELPGLCRKISKKTTAVIVFDSDPTRLIEKVYSELEKKSKNECLITN